MQNSSWVHLIGQYLRTCLKYHYLDYVLLKNKGHVFYNISSGFIIMHGKYTCVWWDVNVRSMPRM
jgi:hypothetical protein